MSLKENIALPLRTARKKFLFFRENYLGILIWPLAALAIGVAGWSILHATLEQDRRQIADASLQRAAVLARDYALQVTRMLETTDQILLHVKYEWQLSSQQLKLEQSTQRGLFPPPALFFIAIADRNGNLLTSTIDGGEQLNVSDQPYFLAQKNSSTDMLYMGMPPRVRSGSNNVTQFSRKLVDPRGHFNGIVLASVSPRYLTADYDDSALGNHGYLGLFNHDNSFHIARTGRQFHSPAMPALQKLPRFSAPNGHLFMQGEQWFIDQRDRYVGWHNVGRLGIVALAGLDVRDTLAPFEARRHTIIRLGMAASVVLALFALTATLLSLRLAARKRELALAQATYRKATEEGNEGFYIARPIHGADGALADFQIIDANNVGAGLFGWRRSDFVGKRLSALGNETQFSISMEWLRAGMAAEAHETDLEVPQALGIKVKWLHFKSIRSNGDLAITIRDISAAKDHLHELERRSNEDELTGLPNRRWAKSHLGKAIARAADKGETLAVLYIDLDGFKTVNDTMGHAAGDELLRNVARRLQLAVRPQDHVVRLGGDEFAIILERLSGNHEIIPVAERILQAFRQGFRLTQGVHTVGTSIGISVFPDDGDEATTLLRHADIAMYAVKTAGKANYRFYDPKLYEATRLRHEREYELRHAIAQDQFVMYYQPRVDTATGATSSMESLLRWQHPTRGLIGPNEFIPLAEETGLIRELGQIVIHKVIAQIAFWERAGTPLVPVSINVSPRQFRETDVKGIISAALARHRVDTRLIEIEVTESSMMGDSDEVTRAFAAIQAMGIRLLVDDFGTGYSSLSQLQQLDFDVLKVDRAFTSNIGRSEAGNVFFKAIVTMAHALGMRVVAEGVENAEQIRILKFLRCDELQGYYISKPLPATKTQPILPHEFLPSVA